MWAGCFVGICGLQRLYTGRVGSGLLYLFSFGLLGIGQAVDLFLIPRLVSDANEQLLREQLHAQLLAGGAAAATLPRLKPRTTEEFQVALVQAAEKHGGSLTVSEAVMETGRGFKDVKAELDRMVVNGYIEVDTDDRGLVYRFPGLEPQPRDA